MNGIQDKIRKLLALSNSSNEFEARDALLKAQELMVKYNMKVDGETKSGEIINEYVNTSLRMVRNHGILAGVIAHNFRTIAYFRGTEIHFLGYSEDVYASVRCIEYAFDQIQKGVSRYINGLMQKSDQGKSDLEIEMQKRQWINGFVKGLHDAFKKHAEDSGFEIMLVVSDEVKEEFSHIPTIPSRERRFFCKEDLNAFKNGYANGEHALKSRMIG